MSRFQLPQDLSSPEALSGIFATCWDLLIEATLGNGTGWRLPCLATTTNGEVRQRTIVLRTVNRNECSLLFHTDVRSTKVEQLRANPNVSLLFYDPQLEVQLQVRGTVAIHTDTETANTLWESSTPASLKMYLAPMAPGTTTDGPDINLPESMRGRLPERFEIIPGRDRFAVIQVNVQAIEWLRLSRDGSLRALFQVLNGQLDQAAWIAP